MHSTAMTSILSLALILRGQKTCTVLPGKGTGTYFYSGKWQSLKFSLKEVNDLLKAMLTLKEILLALLELGSL